MARTTKFAGVTLKDGRIESRQGGGPVAGARATIESAGEIQRRITASRLVLTGPLALAWRKKRDLRELYLTVEGNGFGFTVRVDPKLGLAARQFAATVNAESSKWTGVDAELERAQTSIPAPAPAGEDVADRLRKLAELRDEGILTDEELAQQKAAVLGTATPATVTPTDAVGETAPPGPSRSRQAAAGAGRLLAKGAEKAKEAREARAQRQPPAASGAWHPDPQGHHELRWWDGDRWTEHVSDAGVTSTDPLS